MSSRMLVRVVIHFFAIAVASIALAQPVELEVVGESEGVQMKLVEEARDINRGEVERLLDPNDCDPYMHIYVVSTAKCIKMNRRSRPYIEVRAGAGTEIICRLSKNRYFKIVGAVDRNAPCYGKANGQILRGEVFVLE